MKKLVFMLMGFAAAINAMAVDYTAKANLLLEATSGESCKMYLRQADSYGALGGSEMYMEGREVALYALNGEQKLQTANAADFTNVKLGLLTDASASYTITVSNVSGAELVLWDLVDNVHYTLENNLVINITNAAANSTIEDRFVINYVAPAATCNEVRTGLTAGYYYTICLDKDVTSYDGASSFWSMSKRGAGVAYLEEETGTLIAGKPYIFQASADALCVVYGVGSTTTAGAEGALHGTFEALDQADLMELKGATATGSDIFLMYQNELRNATVAGASDNSLAANRAYVVYDELILETPQPAPGRRVRAIPMQGQVATDIEAINASEAATKFVENGQIFIRRGNEVFNLQGQIVK